MKNPILSAAYLVQCTGIEGSNGEGKARIPSVLEGEPLHMGLKILRGDEVRRTKISHPSSLCARLTGASARDKRRKGQPLPCR